MTFAPLRVLSEADCHDIAQRIAKYASGGGYTVTTILSTWRGNVRWARNQISTSGDVQSNDIVVYRNIHGALDWKFHVNEITDSALMVAVRRAERLVQQRAEWEANDLYGHRFVVEPFTSPPLYFDATAQLEEGPRAAAARSLVQSATDAGMLSSGYIEVSAHSLAVISTAGWARYFPYTWARYSVTVRDPTGTGSGWAGVDWPDWSKIDGPKLSAIALDKCVRSRHPVTVEPGRYTTILEPQAVCDFITNVRFDLGRVGNEKRLGQKVMDERITIRSDPMDPELATVPFMFDVTDDGNGKMMIPGEVYHAATFIDKGKMTYEGYNRTFAALTLGRKGAMNGNGSFRMTVSGETTSIEEMIATTKRGLLVTRFDKVQNPFNNSLLCRGYTRDGLWLIENGAIAKPVKNMAFTENPWFALNNVEQLGVPQRAFNPPGYELTSIPSPVIVPPMKVRDFSFTALADSV